MVNPCPSGLLMLHDGCSGAEGVAGPRHQVLMTAATTTVMSSILPPVRRPGTTFPSFILVAATFSHQGRSSLAAAAAAVRNHRHHLHQR